MKKLSSLILISVVLFSGVAVAQDAPERPGGIPGSGPTRKPGRPVVPQAVKSNSDFQQWTTDFRTVRESFKTRLQGMRAALLAADEADKDGIRKQIREQMKLHRAEQIAFRKRVRALMSDLREARTGAASGPGG